jgi:hypothetical protein
VPGYVRRLVCGHLHQQRVRLLRGHSGPGWSSASLLALDLCREANGGDKPLPQRRELFCHMAHLRQELIQFSLSIGQLPSPLVANTETGHDAVDDQQHKFPTCKLPCQCIQQLVLVLAVECSGIEDSSAVSGSTPKRSAICVIRSGRKVTSVSM